ncbi:hypothetical protein NM208_g10001 [Fusarium decemcellulare]|uniref:Uncharacterized protein n=1 Tax=Fusarium decemcellulare TaxID=57161 RepID=A0ACC1RZG4_9HYPO|nr:hypothetical protein NM208_g10001 [Fusarium decemcellulare]
MAGLQANIYAAVSITWSAAILALVLRLIARRMTKMKLWFDDYFTCVALAFASTYCSITIFWTVRYRLGQSLASIQDIDETDHIREKSRLLLWICELCYAASVAFSKLAILSFYWRVFRFTSIRTFIVIFHCVPVQAYWDKSITDARCPFNEAAFFFCTVLIHCLMDCIILILPVIEVMKMHLPSSQKLAVVGLFTSGTIVCVASVFVLIQSIHYNPRTREMPKEIALNMLWAAVEVNMAIFSACLPMLRPIFRQIIPGLSTAETSHHISLPPVILSRSRTHSSAKRLKREESRRTDLAHGFVDQEWGVLATPSSARSNESRQISDLEAINSD